MHTHFHASRDAWTAELINVAQEISEDIWIERIRLETNSPVELEQLAEQSDLTAQVIAALQVLDTTALPDRVTDLMSKLPPAAQLELQGLDQERLQANVSALVIDALTASATHEI